MASLSTSNYQTVWSANFTNGLDSGLFPIRWGNSSEFSYGSNGLTLTSDGTAAGFMTADTGTGASYGYGLYSASFSMPQGSTGGYVTLWPSNNVWPGPEIDLGEQANGQVYLTVHWAGSGDSNAYQYFVYGSSIAGGTTVSVDWEANSLTFYVNGNKVVQYNSGGSVPIPKDAADGGTNEAFGVGNVGRAGDSVTISKMSYSKYIGGSSSTSTSTGTTTGSTTTAVITSQNTTGGTGTSNSVGNANSYSNQTIFTSQGTDILVSGHGYDSLAINDSNPDGWAEIDNWHKGDVAIFLGAGQNATITWTEGTDPNGVWGATAHVSDNGDGHIDTNVTFAGVSAASLSGDHLAHWTYQGQPIVVLQS